MPQRTNVRRGLLAALCYLTLVLPAVGWAREEVCPPDESCAVSFPLTPAGSIPIYQNHSLTPDGPSGRTRNIPDTTAESIERAVIVIHGNRRDADRYYEGLLAAAKKEAPKTQTLLLAPNFQTASDGPAPGQVYWSSSGWKAGNRSRSTPRISSFAVLDQILGAICPDTDLRTFPGMKTVVIVGHSAGGQYVQRYAAGGAGCPDREIDVRYVVMNPSSYVYIDDRRRAEGAKTFQKHRFGCWKFNEYKYGLEDLNAYMEDVGVAKIREQLFNRAVYYLAGEDDDRRTSKSLDKSCEGNLQGPERLTRHRNYRDYAALFDDWRGSVFLTVPDIGHNGAKMLRSETARKILFR